MKRTNVVAVMIGATGLLLSAAASAHQYTWVDGGVLDRDGDDDMGIRMAGSAAVSQPVALFGEVVDTGPYSQLSAGAMFHTPLDSAVDFTMGGSLEAVDTGRRDDTGLGARIGLRWAVPATRGFELNPELRHVMVFDSSITSVRANALLALTQAFHLQGALQAGDDDRIEIGMRYSFLPYGGRPSREPAY